LNGRQDVDEVVFLDHITPEFEDGDAATVQEEVPALIVVSQQYIPEFHGLVKSKLLSQEQGEPTKAVVLWFYLFFFQSAPYLQINNLQIPIE
jgi:hypothetical protein